MSHALRSTGLWSPALAALLLMGTACGGPAAETAPAPAVTLDTVAESYVRLVLAVGRHDPDYVDAFYGPRTWQAAAAAGEPQPLAALEREGERLRQEVADVSLGGDEDPMVVLRQTYLERQLAAVVARIQMLGGTRWSFDEESQALYDAIAPRHSEASLGAVMATLGDRLAAEGFDQGSVIERYEAFRAGFVIPPEQLDEVFRVAIDACRERTRARVALPENERFVVEYVTGKSWSAYNWYQGDFASLIQVNTDLPVYIDRAIDLACHEGYPGHHVYNVLLEKALARDRGWVEVTVYPLFSPQSLIAEGTANFGIDMAFPGDERLTFEREVLYPIAGIDPARAAVYSEIQALVQRLSYAGNEAARAYLDGDIDAEEAAAWLGRFAATPPERAAQRVRFFDQYRSYVINYNLGRDLVGAYLDRVAGQDAETRWTTFEALLSSQRLPSGLR